MESSGGNVNKVIVIVRTHSDLTIKKNDIVTLNLSPGKIGKEGRPGPICTQQKCACVKYVKRRHVKSVFGVRITHDVTYPEFVNIIVPAGKKGSLGKVGKILPALSIVIIKK